MKKRLLISSVLMSAVLACALGTGTYAWYKVQDGTLGKVSTATGQITTTDGVYSLGVDNIVFAYSNVVAPAELSNEDGETWYVDTNYAYQKTVAPAAQIGTASVTATWEHTTSDYDEKHKALAGQTVTVYVSASSGVVLLKNNSSAAEDNALDVQYIEATATVNVDGTINFTSPSIYFAVRPTKGSTDKTADSENFGNETGTGGTLSFVDAIPSV